MWWNKEKNDVSNITFRSIGNAWLRMKKNSIKESTYSNYLYCMNKYLMPKFGNYLIKDLQEYNFNDYVEELANTLSPRTIRSILCVLKSILYFAEEEYGINIKIRKIVCPKLDLEPLTILSKKEKEKIINYCLNENSLKSLGIVICLNTGLRVGEICALKWQDIDLEKREIHIKNTLQRIYIWKSNKTEIRIDKPKTKTSARTIPISTKVYNILVVLKKKYKNDDYFLTGDSKKYVEPRNYQYTFKCILKKNQIKKYKFHILRHTFATNCIEVGMDIKSLSEILGHSNVEMTLNQYVHSSYKIKKKYLEKL